jgi:hypothetical protein
MGEARPDDIDGIFKDPLQSYLDEPSEEVWERIENHLDKEDNLFYKSGFRFLLRICACLFVIIIGLGTIIFDHYKYDQSAKSLGIQQDKKGIIISPGKTEDKIRNDLMAGGLNPGADGRFSDKDKLVDAGLKNLSKDKNPAYYNKYIRGVEGFVSGKPVQSREVAEQKDGFLYPSPVINIQPPKPEVSSFDLGRDSLHPNQTNDLKKIAASQNLPFLSRFSVAVYFSQEFAGYNLSDNNDSTGANGKEIEKKERSVFSASGGVFLNYRLKKRWVIQSGLSYSWSNSILDPSESYAVKNNNGNIQFRVNTISGYGYLPPSSQPAPNVGDSVLTDKVYSNLHYLTVPLIASYRINLRRLGLLAGVGVTFNFLTDATVETKILGSPFDQHESMVTMNGLKKINYGILLKAELQYNINSNWGISLIPCFKNALSPINIHSALSTYPYNFGIGLGISHRF